MGGITYVGKHMHQQIGSRDHTRIQKIELFKVSILENIRPVLKGNLSFAQKLHEMNSKCWFAAPGTAL
jgi:hypothetical protein